MDKNAQALGKKGGLATKANHPHHLSEISKRAWTARKLREDLLKDFTLEDLQNPVTFKSIQEKLEAIDRI